MAGIPPPPDAGAGRGRGMTLPSWMAGPNPATNATAPGAPTGSMSMQFRPPPAGQLGQQFPLPGGQPLFPGVGPPQYPQIAPRPNQLLPSVTPSNFNQQQRPGSLPQSQTPGAVGAAPPPVVGVTPAFQFATSASFPQPSYGITPPIQASTPSQPLQNLQSHMQAWPGMSSQPGPPAMLQTSQLSTAILNSTSFFGQGSTPTAAPSPPPSNSDWQEHTAPDGRRYYYNKKTKVSSWEKPIELMTSTERADASTVWKEFTTSDGRKYYYNKLTKQSKWTMPEEMKLAREKAEHPTSPQSSQVTESVQASGLSSAASPSPSLMAASSPASLSISTPSNINMQPSGLPKPSVEANIAVERASPAVTPALSNDPSSVLANAEVKVDSDKESSRHVVPEEPLSQETEKNASTTETVGVSMNEDKPNSVGEDHPVYLSKTEAKTAFKELLETSHVGSDWSWDQTMRVIANDKRYGVLKSLGERKQAFNEYVAQKKKQEAEERRLKQKKAREEFIVMLQECKELTSTMRWSKASALFVEDPRYLAVDKERERGELFEDYLFELEKKEKEKAREDRKKYLVEYKAFLESCDFIKASTQWRKAIDKLEDDERFSRLEKIDRLEIFQEHIKELEKQEDEEKRGQKEQQRRRERKNRDEFRKLLSEDIASGMLTARTIWKDYVLKIKEHPAYEALCTNLTGSTPKDLFEYELEELEKKYQEDKAKVKDEIKAAKINVTSSWTLDMFKDAISGADDLATIDDSNLKIFFEDLLERAKEREEKEAKKRKRILDEFNELLHAEKSITATSQWEECKLLLENAPAFRALPDDSTRQELFEEYVALLQQKLKEKEKKREEEKAKKEKEKEKEREREKRKEKERKEKEREKEREKEKEKEKERERERSLKKEKEADASSKKEREAFTVAEKEKPSRKDREVLSDTIETAVQKEEKKKDKDKDRDRERDRERKHRKSHRSRSSDDGSSDREETKRSRKHGSDKRKSSRKHAYESNSDSETRHKRHKKDHAHRRNGAADELEDGELGEDGEI